MAAPSLEAPYLHFIGDLPQLTEEQKLCELNKNARADKQDMACKETVLVAGDVTDFCSKVARSRSSFPCCCAAAAYCSCCSSAARCIRSLDPSSGCRCGLHLNR
jgi:hypothetical protein